MTVKKKVWEKTHSMGLMGLLYAYDMVGDVCVAWGSSGDNEEKLANV